MHCPQCQHENRTGAKFCEACGSKLELTCPACGNSVRPEAAFCDNCGAPLARQSKVQSLKSQDQPLVVLMGLSRVYVVTTNLFPPLQRGCVAVWVASSSLYRGAL